MQAHPPVRIKLDNNIVCMSASLRTIASPEQEKEEEVRQKEENIELSGRMHSR